MREYADGTLAEILETHGINMERANRCIRRHNAIVKALDEYRKGND